MGTPKTGSPSQQIDVDRINEIRKSLSLLESYSTMPTSEDPILDEVARLRDLVVIFTYHLKTSLIQSRARKGRSK